MYISSDQHTKLAQGLFDKMLELRASGERHIKTYEVAFQNVIEEVFPNEAWFDMTDCDIFTHLMKHKNPRATVVAILKGLKED